MPKPTDGHVNKLKQPNNMWTLLRLDRYFVPITMTDEILRDLYVSETLDGTITEDEAVLNEAHSKVLKTPGIHFADGTASFPPLDEQLIVSKYNADADCAYLAEFISQALHVPSSQLIRRERSSLRLLVLMAGIGEGKTTLLDYFFRIFIPAHAPRLSNVVRINIDFEDYTNIPPPKFTDVYLASLLLEVITKDLRKDLLQDDQKLLGVMQEPLALCDGVFTLLGKRLGSKAKEARMTEEIDRIYKDKLAMVAGAINYLVREEQKKIVVTLDNVDRLHPASQSQVVRLIRAALRQWDCCAIVCVREYSYGRLWEMTELGFESPMLYHKRPPQFAKVIKKRFTKMPQPTDVQSPLFSLGHIQVQLDHRGQFAQRVTRFLWEDDMEHFLLRACNGNVRQMLNKIKAFLSFWALDLESLFKSGFYRTRRDAVSQKLIANFDNVVRAIIVGNYTFYASGNLQRAAMTPEARETFVLNLVGGPNTWPLLPYRILTYLYRFQLTSKTAIVVKAGDIGFGRAPVLETLDRFFDSYLVESMQGCKTNEVRDIMITRKGKEYFRHISVLAVYLENILNDVNWDDLVEPHKQEDPIAKRCDFLLKSISMVLRLEEQEAERIPQRKRVAYSDFLDSSTYSERLYQSIRLYLNKLVERRTRIKPIVFEQFDALAEQIRSAKDSGLILASKNACI